MKIRHPMGLRHPALTEKHVFSKEILRDISKEI